MYLLRLRNVTLNSTSSTRPFLQHRVLRLLPLNNAPHHLRRLAKIREQNVLDALARAVRREVILASWFLFDEENVGVTCGRHIYGGHDEI